MTANRVRGYMNRDEEKDGPGYYARGRWTEHRYYKVYWEFHKFLRIDAAAALSALLNIAGMEDEAGRTTMVNGRSFFRCATKRLCNTLHITTEMEKNLVRRLRDVKLDGQPLLITKKIGIPSKRYIWINQEAINAAVDKAWRSRVVDEDDD